MPDKLSTVGNRVNVNLGGHLKRFGAGWRVVEVLSIGRKWTQLRYSPCAIRKKYQRKPIPIFTLRGRLPVSLWNHLPKREL